MRYLSQRYAMSYKEGKTVPTGIGTEELAYLETVASIIHQPTRNLTPEEIAASGFGPYYTDHTTGIWPQAARGVPFNTCESQSKDDPITDLSEDLAAERRTRSIYDNVLRAMKDSEICGSIRFSREREMVHLQRFGEALRLVQGNLGSGNFYAFSPAFNKLSMAKADGCNCGK